MTLEQGTPGSLEKDLHSLSLSSSNLANTATSEVSGDDSTDSIQQGPPSLSTSTSTSSNNTAASDSTDEKEVFDLEKRLELKRKEMEILKKIEEQKDREGGWKLTEGEKGELLKKEIGDWVSEKKGDSVGFMKK